MSPSCLNAGLLSIGWRASRGLRNRLQIDCGLSRVGLSNFVQFARTLIRFGMTSRMQRKPRRLIPPQSQIRIPYPPLVLMVAKSGYTRVIRKAGVQRRRPFRVIAISGNHLQRRPKSQRLALGQSRATSYSQCRRPGDPIRAKTLGCLSVCLAPVGLNGCCFRLQRSQPLGLLSGSARERGHTWSKRRALLHSLRQRLSHAGCPQQRPHRRRKLKRLEWNC